MLVVEDDADSREVLTIVLHKVRAVVAAAESAEQAMALLEQRPRDVIIADIGMRAKTVMSEIERPADGAPMARAFAGRD